MNKPIIINEKLQKKYPETYECLLKTFSNLSYNRALFEIFAKTAKDENYSKLDDLFIEISRYKWQNARLTFSLLRGFGYTIDNLNKSINWDNEDLFYLKFKEIAKKEGFKNAEVLLLELSEIKKKHDKEFRALYDELEDELFLI